MVGCLSVLSTTICHLLQPVCGQQMSINSCRRCVPAISHSSCSYLSEQGDEETRQEWLIQIHLENAIKVDMLTRNATDCFRGISVEVLTL